MALLGHGTPSDGVRVSGDEKSKSGLTTTARQQVILRDYDAHHLRVGINRRIELHAELLRAAVQARWMVILQSDTLVVGFTFKHTSID